MKDIDKMIQEELDLEGLKVSDLTQEEMEELREEMEFRLEGGEVLDGVMTRVSMRLLEESFKQND